MGWIFKVIRGLLSKRVRFILVSHKSAKNQIIYSKDSRQFFRYRSRSLVDRLVIHQVFGEASYSLNCGREREIKELYDKIVSGNRTPLIIDCGANIGASSDYFSRYFPKARIVALEPDASNINIARLNCQSKEVIFIQAGVSSDDCMGNIVDPGLGAWAYRTEISDDGKVLMKSISSIIKENTDCIPLLIKIDIEGFEDNVFSKNTEWIDCFPLLVIELHDWMLPRMSNSQNFFKAISLLDRDFTYRGENVFSIANFEFDPLTIEARVNAVYGRRQTT